MRVEWAIKSKVPGDNDEIRLLSWSEGVLLPEDFNRIYDQLAIGTIPSPDEFYTADSPAPWVSIGVYRVNEQSFIVLVHQEWTDQVDVHKRPIAIQTCIAAPYNNLAYTKTSITSFCRIVPPYSAVNLSANQKLSPIEWNLPDEAELGQDVALQIDKMGFDFVASVASKALESSIALLKFGDLSLDQRLNILEAICSLLPYGARADLSLSSWATTASPHTMRIAFSSQDKDQQLRAEMGIPLKWTNHQSNAYDYYLLLKSLVSRYPLSDVIGRLREQSNPLSFQQPGRIVEILREIDRPYLIWDEVVGGRGKPNNVHNLLESQRAAVLKPVQHLDLLNFLIDSKDPQWLMTVNRHWKQGAWTQLVKSALQALEQPYSEHNESYLMGLCNLATQQGQLIALLIELLDSAANTHKQRSTSDAPMRVARVLYMYRSNMRDLGKSDHQEICSALAKHPPLIYELVCLIVQYEPKTTSEWLSWIKEGKSAVAGIIAPFEDVLSGKLNEDAGTAAMMDLGEPKYVEALVLLAQKDQLRRCLISVIGWLTNDGLARSADPAAERHKWQKLVSEKGIETSMSPQQAGALDATVLCLSQNYIQPPQLDNQLAQISSNFLPYVESLVLQLHRVKNRWVNAVPNLRAHFEKRFPGWSELSIWDNFDTLLQKLGQLTQSGQDTNYAQLVNLFSVEMAKMKIKELRGTSVERAAQLSVEVICRQPRDRAHNQVVIDAVIRELNQYQVLKSGKDIGNYIAKLGELLTKHLKGKFVQSHLENEMRNDTIYYVYIAALNGVLAPRYRREFITQLVSETLAHLDLADYRLALLLNSSKLVEEISLDQRKELERLVREISDRRPKKGSVFGRDSWI